jgi:exosortase
LIMPPTSFASVLRGLPLAGKFALAALAAGGGALTVQLWPQWRSNPDLSHGYFMPLLFLLLLHESRTGTPRFLPPGTGATVGLGAALGGALLALIMAGLYAASVDWSHALVNVMLTLSFTWFVVAAGVVFARDSVRLFRFNWPLLVAAGLWLLVTPIPPGTYSRLTLTLQLWVSEGVLRVLHLLGIAAIRHGNIIDLANATVGVEEACSGVRSLISCVFAGVFFSATLVRPPWARALIILLAAPLALLMNFLRSLGLTLLANAGVDIAGTWHDVTGFAVLGVTAAILGGIALLLEREPAPRPAPSDDLSPRAMHRAGFRMLVGGLSAAAVLIGFFVWNTRPAPQATSAAPNLLALLPESSAGWLVRTRDLYEFSGALQTEHLAQRDYFRPGNDGAATEIVIYTAYWRAGQAPVSLVASHTPDACWPGAGWEMLPLRDARVRLTHASRTLPEAEQRIFVSQGKPHHVWFWHLHDGRPIAYRDPYSAIELLRIAWKYGFRRGGDQLFVRISSNRPWSEIAGEPLLTDFFARTRALGL